ncbi:uncharacterized protein A4U43_C05F6190 [Asparagus officinalis]|uniref:CUE domain-containing protein n=1 Tax=Asparagus officinalis TaxID=4686 RepID=A0A5P1EQC3_ASPOF|nr:uncharacterized protein A4U43_C05F6190 [Asparagus officinalis]
MGYKMAYESLLRDFPQVDSRVLKAVAIEHPNDIKAAVEFIVSEVLPSFTGRSEVSDTVHSAHEVSNEVPLGEPPIENQGEKPIQPESMACGTFIDGDFVSFANPSSVLIEDDDDEIIVLETDSHYSSVSILKEHAVFIGHDSVVKDIEKSISEDQLSRCSVDVVDTVSIALEPSHEITLSVNEKIMDRVGNEDKVPKDFIAAFGETEDHSKRLPKNCPQKLACISEVISLDKNDQHMVRSTRSARVVNIDLLEDFIENAKSSKKSLVSEVESVVNMMKEAEVLEERAKQAKEEACIAGQDILIKHAGEVYGEKAVLSTEARELQSRLLKLSDERDKSVSIINEIRETLEARLAAVKDEIAVAEQEKFEKERVAQKALKEQEDIMETIVQESKKLQQEAKENGKLRTFLEDRGQVVDTLQGEIAVICEDVISLKNRVDEHAPLRGSLLMTTYSSSSLFSSYSQKNIPSADELPVEVDENNRDSGEDQSGSREQENIAASSVQKSASDNDWEFLKYEGTCRYHKLDDGPMG